MKVTDNAAMLEIKRNDMEGFYPTLLWDDNNLVIVDTGYPMQMDFIKEAVEKEGFSVENINKIILTHQDIDHIGCVKEILQASENVEILIHEDEAPYVDGRKIPIKVEALEKNYDKLTDEFKEWFHGLKSGFENRKMKITRELKDGDVLPICGGIEIIHTPGHTPGHICLFIQDSKLLISGDALNISDGKLIGANPQYTQNMDLAKESIRKLQNYDVESVIVYHGGLFTGNVKQALDDIVNKA